MRKKNKKSESFKDIKNRFNHFFNTLYLKKINAKFFINFVIKFIENTKSFYFRNKNYILISFISIVVMGLGVVAYNKIEGLNKELQETKSQVALEKKLSEEQLSEQTAKLKDVQEQANQEEIKKNEAKRELAEQQMKENELNADKDNDGLTYRQEISYGTSDSNNDSDGDGIIDGKDVHPAGGGRNIPQTFSWKYGGTTWTFTTSIAEDWYDYYKAMPRLSPTDVAYITSDNSFIKEIADKVSSKAKENNYCDVCFAAAFIQSLPYIDDVYTGYDEYPKYPIETLFEKNGDCEDTSYLTAAIISAMNIDIELVLLPGHMAIAAWADCDTSGTYYKVGDKCYYYIETTGDGFSLGEIPDDYKYNQATLIDISSGDKINVNPQYKKPCKESADFIDYYTDGDYFYSDNQCNSMVNCLSYKDLYYNVSGEAFYWDNYCSQIVTKGCSKSTTYSGYFTDGYDYYNNSMCTQKAAICRPSTYYYDEYWDGYNFYWDSRCTQSVLSWCAKSIYRPGYFFSSIDSNYYYDNQCSRKALR